MTTIYDVAARAGVSAATVSRVMNGRPVRQEAAERVRAAVAELGYTPSRPARSLRTSHAQVIALIIPDIENPFYTAIARGVEDEARQAGYSLVLCNTDDDTEREAAYIDVVISEHMAGAIIAPAADGETTRPLVATHKPVVAVDRHIAALATDAVMVDNVAFGVRATELLRKAGRRRIACITGPQHVETARERAAGWRGALGTAADGELLRWADYRVDGGERAMTELLAEHPDIDGVVVANNLMAVGALAALAKAGRRPEEVEVAVLGDLPFTFGDTSSAHVIPLPAREIGTAAAKLLLERIDGLRSEPRNIVVGRSSRTA